MLVSHFFHLFSWRPWTLEFHDPIWLHSGKSPAGSPKKPPNWKGTSFEPKLDDFGFQMLIFQVILCIFSMGVGDSPPTRNLETLETQGMGGIRHQSWQVLNGSRRFPRRQGTCEGMDRPRDRRGRYLLGGEEEWRHWKNLHPIIYVVVSNTFFHPRPLGRGSNFIKFDWLIFFRRVLQPPTSLWLHKPGGGSKLMQI